MLGVLGTIAAHLEEVGHKITLEKRALARYGGVEYDIIKIHKTHATFYVRLDDTILILEYDGLTRYHARQKGELERAMPREIKINLNDPGTVEYLDEILVAFV